MKVITKYPVYFNSEKVSPKDYYVSANGDGDSFDYADGLDDYELVMGADGNMYYANAVGDMYSPFDGYPKSDLEPVLGADGELYYMGIDGETFYNAKGKRVKDFFKKVGKGIATGAKAVGKFIKEQFRKAVTKSKEVASNVKKNRAERKKKRLENREKLKAEKKLKHEKDEKGEDKFRQNFDKISENEAKNLSPDKVVTIGQDNYRIPDDAPKDAPIVVNTDPNTGKKDVGVDIPVDDVVPVADNQGNIEYYRQPEGGLSKNMKTALIVGGAVVGVALIGFLIYRLNKKK
jgi:hypothetical protein